MSPVSRKNVVVFSLCLLAGVFVSQHILSKNQPTILVTKQQDTWKSIFDEPLNPDKTDCRNLFDKPKIDEDFYPPNYLKHRRQLNVTLKRITDAEKENSKSSGSEWIEGKSDRIEGNNGILSHQSRLFHWLAGRPWVNTICETGFNAGHGTLQWLTGSDHAHVYSFDIGTHYYTRPIAEYLNRTFPGRHHITFGDSTKTVPDFAARHSEVKCDIILVDGGHSHRVATADLKNFRKLVNFERNVLILDDINVEAITIAWNEAQASELAVQIFSCTDQSKRSRSYVIGYYV